MLNWLSAGAKPGHSVFDTRATAPFYAVDGSTLWTLRDLSDGLVRMTEDTIRHHVSSEKNDFANWLEACFPPTAAAFGEKIRGLSREDMVKLFVAASQGKPLPSSSALAYAPPTTPTADGTPPLPHPVASDSHRRAIILPPPRGAVTPTQLTQRHHNTKEAAAEKLELHPKPLPRSPLQSIHDHRVKELKDDLATLRLKAVTDAVAAKDEFITIRTRIWRDLADHERTEILPTLRETYEFLVRMK